MLACTWIIQVGLIVVCFTLKRYILISLTMIKSVTYPTYHIFQTVPNQEKDNKHFCLLPKMYRFVVGINSRKSFLALITDEYPRKYCTGFKSRKRYNVVKDNFCHRDFIHLHNYLGHKYFQEPTTCQLYFQENLLL